MDEQIKVRIGGDTAGLEAAMPRAVGAIRESVDKMNQSLAQLVSGALASVVGITTALVTKMIGLQDEMSKAAQKAGVTTEQFSSMAYAAKLADVGTEELSKAYAHLAKTLTDAQQGQREAAELFQRLKLDPKNVKDADALLVELADRFGRMSDATARTALAIDIFGERIGPKLVPMLSAGREGLAELREEAARLGVVVDSEAGKAAEEFNDTLTRVQESVRGLFNTLAKTLLPTLQAAATEFHNLTKTSADLDIFGDVVRVVFQTIAVTAANVSYVLTGVGREIGAVAAQMAALARLDFAGFRAISEAVKADGVRARAELDAFEARIMALGKNPEAGGGRGFVNPPGVSNGEDFKPGAKKPQAEKAKEPESRMGEWEAQLGERKTAFQRENDLRELSKADEMAYWQALSGMADLSGKERIAIRRKVAQAELEVLREQRAMQTGITQESIEAERQLRLDGVAMDREEMQHRVAMGEATAAQMLQSELQFEIRRNQIAQDAMQQRLAMLASDPTKNAVAMTKLNADIEAEERAHQMRLKQIRGQIAVESSGEMNAIWRDLATSTSTLWDQGVQAMQNGTLTLRGAMQKVGDELINILSAAVKRMVMTWLFGEQAKTGATAAGTAQRLMMEGAAAAKSVAIWAATAVKNIMTSAWEAMAAAWKAVAGIPYVGPFLAVAAAGAAFAGVAGLASNVRSARGGYDIPSGLNPMTQLHEEEMVLPARYANVIRGMADQGEQGAAPAAAAPAAASYTFHIQAVDAAGVRRLLLDNTHALAEAIGKARRDNTPGIR